jgi:hypothetical protein
MKNALIIWSGGRMRECRFAAWACTVSAILILPLGRVPLIFNSFVARLGKPKQGYARVFQKKISMSPPPAFKNHSTTFKAIQAPPPGVDKKLCKIRDSKNHKPLPRKQFEKLENRKTRCKKPRENTEKNARF